MKKIHFIGIGGIGMSALAQYYLSRKNHVSGSDLIESEIMKLLDIDFSLGEHKAQNIPLETDLVIYSPAITLDNPELKQALKLGLEVKSYPQALGELTREYFTIAVSGTHGKSTTSSMISLILEKAGLDPTCILGTKLEEFNDSNFRSGESQYLVIEADEYKRAFLDYNPDILVLTNIEEDHLDYYRDLKDIMDAFREYLGRIKENGLLIFNQDDQNIVKILDNRKNEGYSINSPQAQEIREVLKVPGDHNVSNALAALTCACSLGIEKEKALKTLSFFKGSWRRFQVFEKDNLTLISDYAHHPTEIEKTLKAAREKYPDRKIRCVFQPHQYERTMRLAQGFIQALKQAPVDEIIVCPVYDVAGRESVQAKEQMDSEKLVNLINKESVKYKGSLEEANDYLKKTLTDNEVLIVMGAGDIYNLLVELKNI
jgi:UDP-N-acetylmuramate--alanine ligase